MSAADELTSVRVHLANGEAPSRLLYSDEAGRWIAVNALLSALLGYPADALLRLRLHDLLGAEDATAMPRSRSPERE